MITRIVKMTFREDAIDEFTALFTERKATIRGFEGCTHLELWRDHDATNIFFTYSKWNTEDDLNNYRFSPFFKDTWTKTKVLFAGKAEAWSVVAAG